MGNHAGSPHMANLSSTPASFAGGQASWYDNILTRLGKQPAWPEDKEQAIMEPYCYLDAHPGKEVRSQLIQAFNLWLCVPPEQLEVIRKVVRMLHTSSLLMDDVEDNSDLRRGIPVAHRIYGIPQTINTANYVYFLVFEEIFKMSAAHPDSTAPAGGSDRSPPASSPGSVERFVIEEMINLHRGQGMDLFWRDCLICPTEEEYVEMVSNKTGGLFRIALKLMMAHSPLFESGAQSPRIPDFLPLADLIGLLFQIRDDYMNLQSSEYADNKGFAEDLTEGKFSFPIIHAIRSSGGGVSSLGNSLPASSEKDAAAWSGTPPVGPSPMNAAVPLPNLDRSNLSRSSSVREPPSPIPPNRQILNVLKQRPTDLATKQYTVTYMRQVTKSFAYTRDVLRRLDKQASEEVERIRNDLTSLAQAGAASCSKADEGAKMLIKILEALRSGWYDTADE